MPCCSNSSLKIAYVSRKSTQGRFGIAASKRIYQFSRAWTIFQDERLRTIACRCCGGFSQRRGQRSRASFVASLAHRADGHATCASHRDHAAIADRVSFRASPKPARSLIHGRLQQAPLLANQPLLVHRKRRSCRSDPVDPKSTRLRPTSIELASRAPLAAGPNFGIHFTSLQRSATGCMQQCSNNAMEACSSACACHPLSKSVNSGEQAKSCDLAKCSLHAERQSRCATCCRY
jgi:hypothetical protein